MQGKQKVSLTFGLYKNGVLVRRETLTQDVVKIGRDVKSHLCLDDELASRMHAVIEVAGTNEITIIDLGNEPGTQVNGARIAKTRIAVGDRITIGSTALVLERVEAAAIATAPNPFTTDVKLAGSAFDPFAYNNPFATPDVDPDAVAADAPEGSYTYALVKSGPDMASDECETQASSVEVMIRWGTTVLHVEHLTPPRSFYVGEEQSKHLTCDYFVPAETLGTTRAPIVLEQRGAVSLVLLPTAKGTVTANGQPKTTIADLIARGMTQPCPELAGAHMLPLAPGSKAHMEVGGLVFEVSAVNAGRAVAGKIALDARSLPFTGLSFLAHAAILGAMAFFMPPLGVTNGDEVSPDQQYMLQQALNDASAIKEQADREEPNTADNTAQDKEGGTGAQAKLEEGSMGSVTSRDQGKRYGVQGPSDNQDMHLAKAAALRDAASFGVLGLLNAGAGGDPNAPTAPWGGEDSSGKDALSALGNMWGNEIGESGGAGGLGLSGIGQGGGGKYEGVGLGSIGTIGNGSGTGDGQGFGPGNGRSHAIGGAGYKPKAPIVRTSVASVSGHIPPEVIQRIVRQNFGRFRLCYENGLRNSPNLQGRVSVRFVIGRDGAVSNVGNGGSDMPDSSVVQCVVRAFYGLSFPAPDSGIVTVTYPISFSPG